VLFLGIGLTISAFSRTRVQSLVFALIAWGLAVFVFDLVALSVVVSTKAPRAFQEMELICDATHVNAAADLHSGFDNLTNSTPRASRTQSTPSLGWLAVNPVDLFRAVNLSKQLQVGVPPATIALAVTLWMAGSLGASLWKLRRTDL
jgi:ABC-type transport system involved in multi-copper enzyme maturation permease subunit